METVPDGFVCIQIHMAPEVLHHLRSAARRTGMLLEEWLTMILARGAARTQMSRRV